MFQEQPQHPHFLEEKQAFVTSQLLKVMQPDELEDIKLNHDFRRNLLYAYRNLLCFAYTGFRNDENLAGIEGNIKLIFLKKKNHFQSIRLPVSFLFQNFPIHHPIVKLCTVDSGPL